MTENRIAKSRRRWERFLLDLLEPMAARLADGNVQALQQFVGQSPWEWCEVWARLGRRTTAELEPDSAWVVDDTGFPKPGEDSVGVDRQYSGRLGKTVNCPVAVSLHHAGEQGNAVLGWRLYLPEAWTKAEEVGLRRAKAEFGERRGAEGQRLEEVRWREGSKGWLESRFLSLRVQPCHGFVAGNPPHQEIWRLAEWPEAEKEPVKCFFCDLPASYTLRRLVRIAKCRWKIEQDYHQLKEELGLDHYEGRSWNGWRRHVTLAMLAHSFLTMETLRGKRNFRVDPARDSA